MPPKRKIASIAAAAASPHTEAAALPRRKKLQTTLGFATTGTQNTAVQPPAAPAPVPVAHYDQDIVDRKYYPPVLSDARCAAYSSGNLAKPIDELHAALSATAAFRSGLRPGRSVVHWFRTDLRPQDNTALHLASASAASAAPADCSVIGLYVFSTQDFEAHVVSPARLDFILQSLQVLRQDLAKLAIPLHVEAVERRHHIPATVVALAGQWAATHVFANMEYEVDELRRDAGVVRLGESSGVAVNVVHDACVVPPGTLRTKSTGKPFSVYTPWFRAYLAHLSQNPSLLDVHPLPRANDPVSARARFPQLFAPCDRLPAAPPGKVLSPAEQATVRSMFPAGSHEAQSRLARFLDRKASQYSADRNFPAKPGTSLLSPHFAAGTLSARTALSHARAKNSGRLSGGQEGLDVWISEVAWRDFYKHVLCAFPHICMNKPFKPEYAAISWAPPPVSSLRFNAWVEGQTGYPIVDAAMRQLAAQKFLPNRLRMVVASFLCKDLLVDWRRGERYFSSQLVDGDFASNNGGWGFSSSAGVDPQPYFRVFNPTTQSEKFDADGEYIRTWVPELHDVRGKEVHRPSDPVRRRTGYVPEIVAHEVQRKLAVDMYREGIARGKAEIL